MSLPPPLLVRQAAFQLALRVPWHKVTLATIAAEAGLTLSELRQIAPSKGAILSGFSRDIDNSLLENLAKQPPSGDPHDRLFDVILRRLEIMGPYRENLAGILRSPVVDPDEGWELLSAATRSVGWMLASAGLEADRHWRGMQKLGLLHAYWRTLQVWAEDEDSGLTRTMAALDRRLRDAEGRIETLHAFAKVATSARLLTVAFWNRITQQPRGEP
jgi:hypothetical protein